MSEITAPARSPRFRIGYGILLFFTGGNVLGHIGLLLFDPSGADTVFLSWAAFNLLAVAILLVPYRRGERWAWYTIWALIAPYALIILFNAQVGPIYMGEALLMTIGQLLTFRAVSP